MLLEVLHCRKEREKDKICPLTSDICPLCEPKGAPGEAPGAFGAG